MGTVSTQQESRRSSDAGASSNQTESLALVGFQEIDPKIERYNGEVELCSRLDVLSSVGVLVVHPTEEIELCFGGHTSGGFGGPNRPRIPSALRSRRASAEFFPVPDRQ
jgi:hypothetical protein